MADWVIHGKTYDDQSIKLLVAETASHFADHRGRAIDLANAWGLTSSEDRYRINNLVVRMVKSGRVIHQTLDEDGVKVRGSFDLNDNAKVAAKAAPEQKIDMLVTALKDLGGIGYTDEMRSALGMGQQDWNELRFSTAIKDSGRVRRDYESDGVYNLTRALQADSILSGRGFSRDANMLRDNLSPELKARLASLCAHGAEEGDADQPWGPGADVDERIEIWLYLRIVGAVQLLANLHGLEIEEVAHMPSVAEALDQILEASRASSGDVLHGENEAIRSAQRVLAFTEERRALHTRKLRELREKKRHDVTLDPTGEGEAVFVAGVRRYKADLPPAKASIEAAHAHARAFVFGQFMLGSHLVHRLRLAGLWRALADLFKVDAAALSRGIPLPVYGVELTSARGNPMMIETGVRDTVTFAEQETARRHEHPLPDEAWEPGYTAFAAETPIPDSLWETPLDEASKDADAPISRK